MEMPCRHRYGAGSPHSSDDELQKDIVCEAVAVRFSGHEGRRLRHWPRKPYRVADVAGRIGHQRWHLQAAAHAEGLV